MSEWQSIETAPKDGQKIDLWVRDERTTDVFWDSVEEWWCVDSMYGDQDPVKLAISPVPSHWMPPPPPPGRVEDDVPLLNPARHPGAPRYGFQNAVRLLETGQSIFVSGRSIKSIGVAGYRVKRESGGERQFACRTVEGGVRIWRIS